VKISTITKEYGGDPLMTYEFSQFVFNHFTHVLKKLFHEDGTVTDALWSEEGEGPLEFLKGLRAKPFLISKSGPAVRGDNVQSGAQSTSPASILASAHTWLHSPLYPILRNWCNMTNNQWVLNRIESWAKELWVWEDSLPLSSGGPKCPFEATNWLGKLGFKPEPAGKVRVFAMVDPWTQWLFDRLHKAIFGLLERIPQDGTFDQERPIRNLFTWKEANEKKFSKPISLYSFDLSAATDRLPIVLQKVLLSPFLTSWGAELWGCLMVGRKYHCPKTIKFGDGPKQTVSELGFVQYATGQPMGALSSWAMLAFLHHAIVQWSALRAGVLTANKPWYEGYAVLGDDVVIARDCVAKQYAGIMKSLDVGIGDHKSLISTSGSTMEFAKRTFRNGVNVSMVPFAEFVVGRQSLAGLLELVRKYSLSFGQMLSVLGYGYRAKASASKRLFSLPKRLRNYIITFYGPGGPGYTGLKGWLPLKSVTSLYKTSMTRVQGLCRLFFESEVKLILEYLDSYSELVALAKRLGTVYRDREHYGTTPRDPSRASSHPGIEATTPSEVVDSLNETVYREAFMDVVITARDLRTKLEEILLPQATTETKEIVEEVFCPPEGWYTKDGQWYRPQTLEEYNARLELVYESDPKGTVITEAGVVPHPDLDLKALYLEHLKATVLPEWISEYDNEKDFKEWVSASVRKGRLSTPSVKPRVPFVLATEVPTSAAGVAVAPPVQYRTRTVQIAKPLDSSLPGCSLDWESLENLWTQFREIETEFAALPFPRNIQTRVSEGKPPTSESKMLKRWYRYSSTFRATVDPVNNS
jgi:hypothetical protein